MRYLFNFSYNFDKDTSMIIDDMMGHLRMSLMFTLDDGEKTVESVTICDDTCSLVWDEWMEFVDSVRIDLKLFLDVTSDGVKRKEEYISRLPNGIIFDNVCNSALYSFEKLLGCVVSESIKPIPDNKWYMRTADAVDMMVKEWRKDRSKIYSFCHAAEDELTNDPYCHNETDGNEWWGIKLIDASALGFDASKRDFAAIIGFYGGGTLMLAYVPEDCADDYTCAAEVLRNLNAGCDVGDCVYIEEEKGEN